MNRRDDRKHNEIKESIGAQILLEDPLFEIFAFFEKKMKSQKSSEYDREKNKG